MLTRPTPVMGTLRDSSRALLTDFCCHQSVQVFHIDAARLTTLVSHAGTRFTFAPGSFLLPSGEPVQGEVQIQLKEVSDKNTMILCDRLTTSEDRLLEAIQQFWIGAYLGETPLQLGIPIAVEIPVPPAWSNLLSPRLFVGSLANTLTSALGKTFDWQLVSNKSLKIKRIVRKKFFNFYITELNWFACSAFHPQKAPRTMMSARCETPVDDLEEQAAYLVFRDLNAVTRMYPNVHRFTGVNIPVHQTATMVMIGFRQGEWFYGTHPIDKTSSQLVTVALEPILQSQLIDYLKKV